MWYVQQQRLRPACAYTQTDQSLCQSFEYSMCVKLLTEHHLEFLSLKGGCTGSSESTHVKMPHCWNSHVAAVMHKTDNWILNFENDNVAFVSLLCYTHFKENLEILCAPELQKYSILS